MNLIRPEMDRSRRQGVRNLFLSFLIPFFIMYLGVLVMHVTPYGEHSLALSDGETYLNGLMSHARMLRGQENILYSLNGLGSNTWAGLAWGGFNPVKLLSLFATIDTIPSWFTWMSLVNMSVCGLTMYLMLSGIYGHKASHLFFSTSYAMMGFNVVNCFQILFFIGPQMLPVMVLGLIRLLKGKSPLLYILSLFFCIFCNFYFGLMLCIASVLIFTAYCYIHWKELKGQRIALFTNYAIASVISGLMASVLWLPALKAYSGGGRLDQTTANEYQFVENMPFVQIFSKLFTGANSTSEMIEGLPNIFCGIMVVALVVLFFMNRSVSKKLKKSAVVILTIYLVTFYIKAFTLVMHGFTHTNWFPYRYSYVFSFFLIWISAEQFRYIGELKLKDVKKCGTILLLSAVVIFSTQYEFISGAEVLLDFALLALMGLVFYWWKRKPERFTKQLAAAALLLLVSVNLFANYVLSIQKIQNEESWELNLTDYQTNTLLSGGLVDGINNYDHSFFRMEKEVSESGSLGADAALYNYNGIGSSGPSIRMFMHKQLNKLGVNWFDMRQWYSEGITGATDTLLGVKYVMTDRDLEKEKGYKLLASIGEASIYQNPNALSVAVLSDAAVKDVELGSDAFQNLNEAFKAMTGGNRNIFSEEENITFTFHDAQEMKTTTSNEIATSVAESVSTSAARAAAISEASSSGQPAPDFDDEEQLTDGPYIECKFIAQQDGPVYFFDQEVPESASGRSVPCVACLGVFKKGDEVEHHFNVAGDFSDQQKMEICSTLTMAYADNEVLRDYAKELNSRNVVFNVEHENDLTGTFTAEKNQRILFTLPWDEGWSCYIDGQKVPIDKTWDLFMSVEVPEGAHTYEMKFFPAWMNIGIGISCGALLGLIVFMVLWKRNSKQNTTAAQT